MLIALLAVLGVDLVVIVSVGEVDGIGGKWKRGYGRWVRDVLVWTKAPFLLRNVLLPTDGLEGKRRASSADGVKGLGDQPVVAAFACGDAVVEIATGGEHSMLLGSSSTGDRQ
jgi:hypothetical protein